jgi:hypothetical protein
VIYSLAEKDIERVAKRAEERAAERRKKVANEVAPNPKDYNDPRAITYNIPGKVRGRAAAEVAQGHRGLDERGRAVANARARGESANKAAHKPLNEVASEAWAKYGAAKKAANDPEEYIGDLDNAGVSVDADVETTKVSRRTSHHEQRGKNMPSLAESGPADLDDEAAAMMLLRMAQ